MLTNTLLHSRKFAFHSGKRSAFAFRFRKFATWDWITMMSEAELIQQAEQDLRWLVDCPSLIDSPLVLDLPDPFASEVKFDWSPVLRFHETRAAYRVGYYVESLVHVWLDATQGVSNLEHGIQIIRGKETLGELDFLFRKDGRLHHLEVALKFYLYSPDHCVGESHFIGPNAGDTFERKRDRLFEKQIPFGREFFPGIDQSHVLVKGMVFYRPGNPAPQVLPEKMNANHARGLWSFESEQEEILGECRGAVLPKPFWLGTPDPVTEAARIPGNLDVELGQHESRLPARPKFIHLSAGGHREHDEKLFLVPTDWAGKK